MHYIQFMFYNLGDVPFLHGEHFWSRNVIVKPEIVKRRINTNCSSSYKIISGSEALSST
ncbi:unnamed protein product [Moneuplotes crassus]|uniref:Uncharacterized protein n=1 Tax=Euplotes crassus TaxID=5936 RepID=A0AAD1YA91_EUPCR|nr:unnamed protein product [Moneuplotes crassus]